MTRRKRRASALDELAEDLTVDPPPEPEAEEPAAASRVEELRYVEVTVRVPMREVPSQAYRGSRTLQVSFTPSRRNAEGVRTDLRMMEALSRLLSGMEATRRPRRSRMTRQDAVRLLLSDLADAWDAASR